ncbi:MAG: alpha/beta fold hydrolase [Candidatus Thiodiazotropha sp.]
MQYFPRAILIALLCTSCWALASDLAKEKRWAEQIVDALIDGEAVWLNDGKSDFLGLYTEAGDDKGQAAIILHGTGVHPDWQQVVKPLRVELPMHGWRTLSIQMPVLPNEADYKEYVPLYPEVNPRINAAIAYLRERGVQRIVLVGHSQGATMGAFYLRSHPDGFAGFVSIGMSGNFGSEVQDGVRSLGMMQLPVLDLYGSDDLEGVLESVEQRAQAASRLAFTQRRVEGANHFFDGKEADLVGIVSGWLEQL